MTKKVTTKPTTKPSAKPSKKPQLFYVNKDKYQRATKLANKPSEVKAVYEKLGGKIQEGSGYIPL